MFISLIAFCKSPEFFRCTELVVLSIGIGMFLMAQAIL